MARWPHRHAKLVHLGVHFGVVLGGFGDLLAMWVAKFLVWVSGLVFKQFGSENHTLDPRLECVDNFNSIIFMASL